MASERDIVEIRAFGKWLISVNGVEAPSVQSRFARQILVALSLTSGWIAREKLIDDLWSSSSDIGMSRRRLSKELSRIQGCIGIRLWSGDRESVRVDPGVHLVSDVSVLIDDLGAAPPSADPVREAARLQEHVRVVERGMLLPGHFDPWTCDLRSRVEQLEIGIRRSLVELLGRCGRPDRVEARPSVGGARLVLGRGARHRHPPHTALRRIGGGPISTRRKQKSCTGRSWRSTLRAGSMLHRRLHWLRSKNVRSRCFRPRCADSNRSWRVAT